MQQNTAHDLTRWILYPLSSLSCPWGKSKCSQPFLSCWGIGGEWALLAVVWLCHNQPVLQLDSAAAPAVHRGKAAVQWKEMSGAGTAATGSWEDLMEGQWGLKRNGGGGCHHRWALALPFSLNTWESTQIQEIFFYYLVVAVHVLKSRKKQIRATYLVSVDEFWTKNLPSNIAEHWNPSLGLEV